MFVVFGSGFSVFSFLLSNYAVVDDFCINK